MHSVWSKQTMRPKFETLQKDIHTDVLVIGGGLAGILCAYMLKQAGVDYVLVEAKTICGGITKNTTAKITSQHGLIYDKLIKDFGAKKASMYLHANQQALEQYKKLCAGIDCDFEEKDSFVYARNSREKLEKEVEALQRLNFHAEVLPDLPLPFETAGAVRLKNQAQFHPLKFVKAIAKHLKIYEKTKVKELRNGQAITDGGKITANNGIVRVMVPVLHSRGS